MKAIKDCDIKNALYKSNGTGRPALLVTSIVIMIFAAIILVIFNVEKFPSAATVSIICYVVLAVCAVLLIVAIVQIVMLKTRPVFVLFETKALIYAKSGKKYKYVRIDYSDIVGYKFEAHVDYDEDDSAHLFPNGFNLGDLIITANNQTYKTQISDISTAREWFCKFVTVKELSNDK